MVFDTKATTNFLTMGGQEPPIQSGGEVVWMAGSCPAMERKGRLARSTFSLPPTRLNRMAHCELSPRLRVNNEICTQVSW